MDFIICSLLFVAFSSIDTNAHNESELRYEEFTSLGRKFLEGEVKIQPSNGFQLKVMTYNILAQTVLESSSSLYKDHDFNNLKWENRWPLIYKKIKDEDPQILFLQEVDQLYISNFTEILKLGYDWVYKKSTGTHEDGVAVFYKSDLFENEAFSQVELNQGVEPLTADKTGVVMRLRVKQSPNHALVVATTHLVFNPHRSNTRLAEIQVMLAEIDRLAYNRTLRSFYPVFLAGDFNLQPYSAVYRFLTEGHLKYEGLSMETLEPTQDNSTLTRELLPCHLGITDKSQHVDILEARLRGEDGDKTRLYNSQYNINPHQDTGNCSTDQRFGSGTITHGFNLRSVYPHKQHDNKIEATTKHNNWITVDYIFYSSASAEKDIPEKEASKNATHEKEFLELLSRERLPTLDEFESHIHQLPNANEGSDHLPLTGVFLLNLD